LHIAGSAGIRGCLDQSFNLIFRNGISLEAPGRSSVHHQLFNVRGIYDSVASLYDVFLKDGLMSDSILGAVEDTVPARGAQAEVSGNDFSGRSPFFAHKNAIGADTDTNSTTIANFALNLYHSYLRCSFGRNLTGILPGHPDRGSPSLF
jgi:hypothetical protein